MKAAGRTLSRRLLARYQPANSLIGEVYPLQVGSASLFSTTHPMQKTKKSVAKRFKITAKGKLLHRSPGTRHLASSKSSKQKRRLGKAKVLSETHTPALLRCLPHGR